MTRKPKTIYFFAMFETIKTPLITCTNTSQITLTGFKVEDFTSELSEAINRDIIKYNEMYGVNATKLIILTKLN